MNFIAVLIGLVIAGGMSGFQLIEHGLILSNMDERTPWGVWEAVYIFCTGLSAGSFVVSALGLLGVKQFRKISRIAVVQAIILLIIAPAFLLISTGRPERVINLYLYPNFTSAISWGSFLLLLYPLICLLYAYFQMRRDWRSSILAPEVIRRHDKLAMVFGLLGIPAAVMVHGYTGFLLSFIEARVLWSSPMMPVLFLTSAIVSGIALLILNLAVCAKFFKIPTDEKIIRMLARMMFVFLAVDLLLLIFEGLTGLYNRGEHYEAWSVLLTGNYSWSFLGCELFLGTLIPLVLLSRSAQVQLQQILVAAVLIIGGIFAMRCNIVLGGQVIQPYGGTISNYLPNFHEVITMAGIFAMGLLVYILSNTYLPLVSKEEIAE